MMRSASELLSTLRGALRFGAPRNVDAASSYTWPVAISVLFHGALLVFITIGWGPSEKTRKVVTPRYVEAQLLQMNAPVIQPEAAQPKVEQPQPQPKEDTAAREREERQEEQRRQEQQRQEAVRQEQARQEQQRKEQEARAEAERKRQAEQKRKEEQAKAEAQKRAEEQKRLEEQKRQEEQRRQQREAREAQARAAQAQADAEAREQLVGSYLGYIQQQVSTRWSRPPSARLGMVAELEIRLDGQARVIGVRVVRSSGNSAFDQAAEHAVRRVEQFDRLRELIQQDRTAFEQNFRTFILKFNPQDLRQ